MALPSLADLQAQLAAQSQRQAKIDADAAGAWRPQSYKPGIFASPEGRLAQENSDARMRQTLDELQAQNNQRAIQRGDPSQSPAAAMQRIVSMGDEMYQDAQSNPVDDMLRAELAKRVTGQVNPYDQTTINALKTGAADQSAAAEAANTARDTAALESRGFTPNDPAYQAAVNANQTQRQQQNQQANLSIAQNANLANYNAQGQAIGQANQVNRGQQAQKLAAGQMATQAFNQVSSQDMGNTPSWKRLPSYVDFTNQQGQKPATQSGGISFDKRPIR